MLPSPHTLSMERLMQYLWQHRLWPQQLLHTTDGQPVRIIDPGRLNTDAGPDFFNAKISIGGHIWAGDVEIHVRASDWHRHNHDGDPAYDSVILHVVDRDDASISRSNGETIPQLCMQCTPEFSRRYDELVCRADTSLPCAAEIAALPPLHVTSWLSSLAFERLYDKVDRITSLLDRLHGDWESTCYVTLARNLGFSVNSDPFERLALSLPLIFIGKHSDSLTSVEALLFGQSGLLPPDAPQDPYVQLLQREYTFLAHKFGLHAPDNLGWKMSRMRPPMFPQRRIALLASILHGGFRMMSRLLDIKSVEDTRSLFSAMDARVSVSSVFRGLVLPSAASELISALYSPSHHSMAGGRFEASNVPLSAYPSNGLGATSSAATTTKPLSSPRPNTYTVFKSPVRLVAVYFSVMGC